MLVSTAQAAHMLNVSDRQVRRSVETGLLAGERVGRSLLLHVRDVVALNRMETRGRAWTENTRDAALDLLNTQDTSKVSGSVKSRLKTRIMEATVASLASQLIAGRAKIYTGQNPRDERFQTSVATELGLAGEALGVFISQNLTEDAISMRLVKDFEGRIVGISGSADHAPMLHAFALYVYGDTRESSAAQSFIEERLQQL